MSKQALVVYNPTARSQDQQQAWIARLVSELSLQDNYVVTLYPTEPQTTSDHIVTQLKPELDLVIAAGGDGTIRQVLAALAKAGSPIPAALVPLGTVNVLARNLGIVEEKFFANSLAHAFDPIASGVPMRIDLGLMNGHYFASMAGAGPISDAFWTPKREAKTAVKCLAYIKAMLETMALPPLLFKITVAGHTFLVQAAGVFVGNVADLGLGKPCQLNELTDGHLNLHIFEPKNFSEYMSIGFRFAAGCEEGKAPHYVLRIKDVFIEVVPRRGLRSQFQQAVTRLRTLLQGKLAAPLRSRYIPAMIDGERCGNTPMHISVVPHAVTVLVPKSKVQAETSAQSGAAKILEKNNGQEQAAAFSAGSAADCLEAANCDEAAGEDAFIDYRPGEITGFIAAAQSQATEETSAHQSAPGG